MRPFATTDETNSSSFQFGGSASNGTIFYIYIRIEAQPFRPPPPPPAVRPTIDPYRVLGLAQGATAQRVRSRYREMAKAIHPDLGAAQDREKRTAAMALLNEAYAMLGGGR